IPNPESRLSSDQLQSDEAGNHEAGAHHTQRLLIDLLQLLGAAFPEAGRGEQEQPLDDQYEAERSAEARHARATCFPAGSAGIPISDRARARRSASSAIRDPPPGCDKTKK